MELQKFKNKTIEFLAFLGLILVGFKLSGSVIAADWSWWLVLAPLTLLVIHYLKLGVFIIFKVADNNSNNQQTINNSVYID